MTGSGTGAWSVASAMGSTTDSPGATARRPREPGGAVRERPLAVTGGDCSVSAAPKFHHSAAARTTTSPANSSRCDRALASMPLHAEERGQLQRQYQWCVRLGALRKSDVLNDDEFRRGLQVVDEPSHVAVLAFEHHRDLDFLQ